MQVELTHEQLEHLVADRIGDLEAYGTVEATAAKLHLDGFQQVVGFFLLDRQVGVAGDPEGGGLLDDHPGEQRLEVGDDEILGGQQALVVDGNQAREQVGHLHPGETSLHRVGVADERGDRQRQIGDVGERMARVDGERCEHGEHPLLVDLRHRLAVEGTQLVPVDDRDPRLGERGA